MKKLILNIEQDLDYDLIRLLLNKLNIRFEEVKSDVTAEKVIKTEDDVSDNESKDEILPVANGTIISLPNEKIVKEDEKDKDAHQFDFSFEFSQQTIEAIIKSVRIIQKSYFASGNERLIVPMIYEDIADFVGKDISSVARVLEGKKYILDGKILFYRDLFSSHDFSTFEGRPVSRFEICGAIKDLIDSEDSGKPLTDDEISEELQKMHYNIARRTVAKFRNEFLEIPSSHGRRID